MSSVVAGYRRRTAPPWPVAIVDVAVTAAVLSGSLVLAAHGGRGDLGIAGSGPGVLEAGRVTLVALATVPLLAWRRWPLGVFRLTATASVLLTVSGTAIWPPLGPTAALYLFAAGRGAASPWTARAAFIVAGLSVACLGAIGAQVGFGSPHLWLAVFVWAAAWFAGERTRLRREQVAELERRATRAEHEAARERLLAVAEERARIARDLHDSAGHALNVIAVRAGAARLRYGRDPDRSLVALTAIEELARQTVAEIDQFVGTLREPGATVETPAGLASLDTLLTQHAAAGLNATLTRTGTARPPGTAADQAAYRIIQEALTNAARHGAGPVRVELAYADTGVEVTVTNPVRAPAPPRPSGGHGLIGMHERANLLGGRFDVGSTSDTFRVRAWLPYGHHA
jgi:signal transduction histidine kinase